MKRIRCKNCGMSLEVKPGNFMISCPMCGTRTPVKKETLISSIDEDYRASDFHRDSPGHAEDHVYVDRVETERKEKTEENSKTDNEIFGFRPNNKKNNSFFLVGFIFVFLFIFLFFTMIVMS